MIYRERLSVPATWWVVGMFFSLTFVTAVGFYAGPEVALVAGLVTAAGVAAALLRYGRVQVVVDEAGLRAGDALLEWSYVERVRPWIVPGRGSGSAQGPTTPPGWSYGPSSPDRSR